MNILVGVLVKNVLNFEGVQLFSNVLDCDYDGSVLDNVMDMFIGGGQVVQ